ncbi:MAG: transketolase family protein [Clostridia bacterium]|nr:transketolase family protein [Clostridia bacterium]
MSEKIATRDAYGKALVELGKENPAVVVLDADLSHSTKTIKFAEAFPQRFFNAGIAEANMTGVAAGLATAGKHPFISSFAVFAAGRAFEQIRNSIVYPHLSVTVAASHAGVTVGEDGGSHQAIEDIGLMRLLPGMTVIVPADAIETAGAVRALASYNGPSYLRLGRLAVPQVNSEDYQFQVGKATVLKEGETVAIFACGLMVAKALEAAEKLADQGISAAVINVSTIKPLDNETIIAYAKKCGAVVTAEEHNIIGGLGSAVAEVLAENCPTKMARVGIEDKFGQSGSPAELLELYGLTAENIAQKAETLLK